MKNHRYALNKHIYSRRHRIWIFIRERIFGVQEGGILPKSAWIVKTILFPRMIFVQYWIHKISPIKYYADKEMFEIYGVKYSDDFFRMISKVGLPDDCLFSIERREDGIVNIIRF